MITKIRKSQVSAEITKEKGIKGIYIEPQPPVPSRGDHYTAQLNYTAVITKAITKEVDT
jgi:hypothetical protein